MDRSFALSRFAIAICCTHVLEVGTLRRDHAQHGGALGLSSNSSKFQDRLLDYEFGEEHDRRVSTLDRALFIKKGSGAKAAHQPPGSSWKTKFEVQLDETRTGNFTMEVHPEWAPLGAARFHEILQAKDVLNGARFFRVVPNFVAQFGIPGDPKVAALWRTKTIKDDPVTQSNLRGFVTFATSGANSRTTQLFINFKDNKYLDGMGFAPFARITEGMDIVDSICSEYGQKPDQLRIGIEGNAYLTKNFPKLSYIRAATEIA
eukprot:TRINITY_DN48944_c0_g1_i1.p1 TRINITY_DN48944_c0_g1~~TRINITY_DN48944_c0_g1_i1.p1  ORF type:complete len:261 (+),score=37.22 TRINITY_DN48944_c0_g1_i1:53-835(+)